MKGLGQNYGLKNGHWSSRNDMHRCHYLWSPGWKWCGSSFNECNSQVSSCLNLCRERRVLGSHCDTNLLMWPRLHLQLTVVEGCRFTYGFVHLSKRWFLATTMVPACCAFSFCLTKLGAQLTLLQTTKDHGNIQWYHDELKPCLTPEGHVRSLCLYGCGPVDVRSQITMSCKARHDISLCDVCQWL